MSLKRIEIENFKGIGARQAIDLRPITLLFGPNSAGKSTILQALHYLREILERGNIDPDKTISGGLMDLGGFITVVHNHDLEKVITIKVSTEVSFKQRAKWLPLNVDVQNEIYDFEEIPIRYLALHDDSAVNEVGLQVDILWSEQRGIPYVSKVAVELDGQPIAAIVTQTVEGLGELTNFNFSHPLLCLNVEKGGDELAEASPLQIELRALAHEGGAELSSPGGMISGDGLRIAVDTANGALPALDGDLPIDASNFDTDEDTDVVASRVKGLTALLSEVILGPIRIVREELLNMTYIGPLRSIPARNYRPQVTPDAARWAHGLAAWDILHIDRTDKLLDEVNSWLSSDEKLQTQYRLERIVFREIPTPGPIQQMFDRGLKKEDIRNLEKLYANLETRTKVMLRDINKKTLVTPSDAGVGISQMIPVIVAALQKQGGILVVEQPELHIQ